MGRILFAGAYARSDEVGISCVRLEQNGELTLVSEYRNIENPSFLTRTPKGCLYAVSEMVEGGELHAFRIGANGILTLLNSMPVTGGAACHVAVNQRGDLLAVSNYLGGTVDLFLLNPDGSLASKFSTLQHSGICCNQMQEEDSHAHFTAFQPCCDDEMLVVDLGVDQIRRYVIERATETVHLKGEIKLPSRSGPRHLAFCPGSPEVIYVVCESELCVYTIRLRTHGGEIIGRQPCIAEPFEGIFAASAIKVDADGMYAYTSTRAYNRIAGEDCIARYTIDPASFALDNPHFFYGVAAEPRDIALTNGFAIIACKTGGRLLSFEIDRNSGDLVQCMGELEIPGVSCVCV